MADDARRVFLILTRKMAGRKCDMKTFALILSAALVVPAMAQRGGQTAAGPAPQTSGIAPLGPVIPAPRQPTAQVTSPVAQTPRSGPILPRGPGAINQPPVVSVPPSVGRTFQRPLLADPRGPRAIVDPGAAVPTADLPPVEVQQPLFDAAGRPVVRVPDTVTRAPFPDAPLVVPNLGARRISPLVPRDFRMLIIPDRQVVVNFPPGAMVIPEPNVVPSPPVSVPFNPVVVPGLGERGTEAAVNPRDGAAVGSAPGAERGQFRSPPRIEPGAPAAPRRESLRARPGTGAQIVRPGQSRLD